MRRPTRSRPTRSRIGRSRIGSQRRVPAALTLRVLAGFVVWFALVSPAAAQVASPTSSPAAAAATPATAAVIRAGSHPTFGRIVIDLPPGATATATGQGGTVRVRIAGAVLGAGALRPPRNVAAITTHGQEATLTLAPGTRFTTERLAARPAGAAGPAAGERLVIDVFADTATPSETVAEAQAAAPEQPQPQPQPQATGTVQRAAPAKVAETTPRPASPAARTREYSGPPPRSGPLPTLPLPTSPAAAATVAANQPRQAAATLAQSAAAAPPVAAAPPSGSPPVPRRVARAAEQIPATMAEAAPTVAAKSASAAAGPAAATSPTASAGATGGSEVSAEQMAEAGASEHVRVPLQRLLGGTLPEVLRRQRAAPTAGGTGAARGAEDGKLAAGTLPRPLFPRAPRPQTLVVVPPPAASAAAAAGSDASAADSKEAGAAAPAETGAAPLADVQRDSLPTPTTPEARTTEQAAAASPGKAEQAAPATAQASPAETAAPQTTAPKATMQAGAQPAAPPGGQAGPVAIAARGDGATLVLPFGPTTGAAAFRRGDQAVVVFDERRPVDLSNLADDATVAVAFGDAQIQLLPAATVLRMSLPPAAGLKLARLAEGWALTRLAQPPTLAPIRGEVVDGTMRLPAAAPGAVVSVPDPDTGGALLVGTQTQPGQGVPVTRRTPDFTLLETLQGVVVDPNSDSLALHVAPADQFIGFLLAAEGDAAVSPKPQAKLDPKADGKAEAKGEAKPGDKKEASGEGDEKKSADAKPAPPPPTESGRGVALDPLGPEALAALDAARMTRRWDLPALSTEALLRRLQAATAGAAAAPPQGRTAGRLAAVQAQLALGMGAEADALANLIVAADARAADQPDVVGLTAVAALLAGRIDEADGIADPRLDGTDEVTLWRAVRLAMKREGAPEAAAGFAATLPLLLAYPAALRERLEPLAAETMLLGGEQAAARRLLAARKDDPQLDYAGALAADADGHPSVALAILDRLAASPDRLLHARASVQAVEVRLKTGALTDSQAADALDKLVYSWRGDKRELAVRLRVAELRDKAGNWRAALALLRESGAGALGQTWPDALPDIHARMVAVFARALEGDAEKALPPLELVSLLAENPDLLPEGEAGRAVAARLADRLVALDLPDRALPVLEKLMNASPEGPARAEIGARLAAVRLDQHDPAGALEALSASAASGLPAAVTEARTITFARATAARGALAPATAALAELGTPAATEAAATLYEQAKDWPGAVNALSAYAKQTVPPEGPLAEAPAGVLLRLASAAAQAGDEHLLAQLRDHDLARMPPGKLADMFRLLTERPVQGVADLPRAAKETALAGALPAELKAVSGAPTKP